MSKKLEFFLEIIEKILNLLKIFFLLHNKISELIFQEHMLDKLNSRKS